MMNRNPTNIILYVLVALAIDTSASWVDFEPIEASSPDAKWQVSARFHGITKWQNPQKTLPADGSLRYEMLGPNKETVWRFDVPLHPEFSSFDTPAQIFVSSAAWTAVRTHSSKLMCFSPKGQRTTDLDILETLLPDRYGDHKEFSWSTAGRMWGQWYAHYYFVDLDGADYFVVRTYWDGRLVVLLGEGRAVVPDKPLASFLAATEKRFVMSALDSALRAADSGRAPREAIGPALTAVLMAGRDRMKGAMDLLHKLESVDEPVGGCFASSEYKPKPGRIDPAAWDDLRLRQAVHLSLRRLGERPRVFPCVRLFSEGSEPPALSELPELKTSREKGAQLLEPGFTPEAVVRLIGAPDFVVGFDDVWEYDMDAEVPYTLAITWGREGVVTIAQIRPPVWQQGDKRDRQIVQ